jgi:osmotically inducible protein OsmC
MAAPATGRWRSTSGPRRRWAGTNPEQLFAVGYAACFESALAAVARRRKVEVGDVAIDSKVDLITGEDRSFGISVELDVNLPSVEGDEAVELVRAAHRVCPYSNATRGNIDVVLTANGEPVEAVKVQPLEG